MGRRLPEQPTRLIGRDDEIVALRRLLLDAGARLLTLTGPAGVGKTHLALELARGLQPAFPDGVVFVDLAPVRDADTVGTAIARAAGVRESRDTPLARLEEHIGERSILLLLDNVEHLLPAAPLISALLSTCPALRVLATSRAPLHLRWEQAFPVPPLALPPAGRQWAVDNRQSGGGDSALSHRLAERSPQSASLSVERLLAYPSVQLFVERARAAHPGFVLDDTNAAAVAAICVALDGLPLAIELGAARVWGQPPQAMLTRLERRLDLLARGPVDLPVRQQTLRGAIGWSHDLLSPEERALFRRLGVFLGGFTAAAAAAVAGGSATRSADRGSADAMLDLLAALVDKSLVRRDEDAGDEPRFSMLETVREYALEQLLSDGELEDARRAHAAVFLALMEQAEPELGGPEQRRWLERLEREHDNVQAALRWATDADGGQETALRLAAAAARFWEMHGHIAEGRAWLERTLEARGHADAIHRMKALNAAGNLARAQGDLDAATARYEASLALLRALGDTRRTAVLLNNLGVIAQDQGDLMRAATLYADSAAIKRSLGDTRGEGLTLNNLGMTALYQGEAARAVGHFTESLALLREAGDTWGMAMALANLGAAALRLGQTERAAGHLRESLRLRREIDDQPGIAWCLEGVAALAVAGQDAEHAVLLLGAAAALRKAIGARLDPAAGAATESTLEAARVRLSDVALRSAWETGRQLTLDAVIDGALTLATDLHESSSRRPANRPGGLSEREIEVLRLLAAGRTNKEIAGALVLSVRTVENHRANVYAKTGAHTRAELVAFAHRHSVSIQP